MRNVTIITKRITVLLLAIILIHLTEYSFSVNVDYKAENKKSTSNKNERIMLVRNDEEKRVDIFIDGKPFTSYIYPETLEKPVLFPIYTSRGTVITRGFPLEPRAGERVDHPHHIGCWFNYGDVNGLDFWNNSYKIPEEKKDEYGTIRHREIRNIISGKNKGILEVTMDWLKYDKTPVLTEETRFIFRSTQNTRVIDRITKLTALDEEVFFKDNKEGLIAIRMDRTFETPSDKPEIFTGANGNPTKVPVLNNEGVNGLYRSSEGLEGGDVWGTRAGWVSLSAKKGEELISIAIIDHPENQGYPTYWHARGYGLFSANNLGQKIFSNGKRELNFKLQAGESVIFKHRILVHSGSHLTDEELNDSFDEFSSK